MGWLLGGVAAAAVALAYALGRVHGRAAECREFLDLIRRHTPPDEPEDELCWCSRRVGDEAD